MVLIGNVGRLYVGYKIAATISHWEAIRSDATLNDNVTQCRGRVVSLDRLWITQPIDRLALRIGRAWWVWDEVESIELSGGQAHIAVRAVGEPELTFDPES